MLFLAFFLLQGEQVLGAGLIIHTVVKEGDTWPPIAPCAT